MIEELIKSQKKLFKEGRTLDINFRMKALRRLKKSIENNERQIIEALKKDLNKSEFEAYTTEIGFSINEIDFMLKNLNRLVKVRRVKTPLMYMGGKSFIMSEPLGQVLIIGPWNYPFQLVISPLIGAIAAGNCVVIKPSEYAPNVSKIIVKVIRDAFHMEYVATVEGGVEVSTELLKEKFDYIFYTGGATVGKIVMEAASKNLTPITLELGGKSPCIIDETAKLEIAAKRIVWGKFLNAGQTCVAPDYILVHNDVKDELVKLMIKNIHEFFGDEPIKSDNYGRIINEGHFNRLKNLIPQGNVVEGGETLKEKLYIAPTILEDVDLNASIMKDEIFGPVFPVVPYGELDGAINFISERSKPLALYIFSNSEKHIDRILKHTSSGGVSINDTISHMTTAYLPFGGVGESGMGSYHGASSFDTFSHKKSVLKNQMFFDLKIKYPPYKLALNKVKMLMKLL